MECKSMRTVWLTVLLVGSLFTPLAGASRVPVHPGHGDAGAFSGQGGYASPADNDLAHDRDRNEYFTGRSPGEHEDIRQAFGDHDVHYDSNALFSVNRPYSRPWSRAHKDSSDADSKNDHDSDESGMPGDDFHDEDDHDFDGPGPIVNGNTGSQAVVPAPGAIWLFGSGIFGLAAVARRR